MFSITNNGPNQKMLTSDYLDSNTKKCEFLYKLILEAEKSRDQYQKIKLYGIARTETENISNSIRQLLSTKPKGNQLNVA